MQARIIASLDDVQAAQWNALERDGNPFLSHEFLSALERNGCLGEAFGWYPQHILLYDGPRLLGASPAYIKTNSYGEFVFDWAWAEAYQRNGLAYYPKLVIGVPYNPVSGPRMLLAAEADPERARAALEAAARALCQGSELTGVHWLFTTEAETRSLQAAGLSPRMGCQYHWHNPGYRDFDDYLDGMIARKRKTIRRERRRPIEEGLSLELRLGGDLDEAECALVHHFYRSTFDRKWGFPTLTEPFFREIARTLPRALVVVFARHRQRIVAASIMLRGEHALYGRFWGCDEAHHSLHFEACYYQGIDYCIAEGLRRFEPGAQGEHKISRGFLPQRTWSAHWLVDERFNGLVSRYLADEREAMDAQCEALREQSPFRRDRAGRE